MQELVWQLSDILRIHQLMNLQTAMSLLVVVLNHQVCQLECACKGHATAGGKGGSKLKDCSDNKVTADDVPTS